MKAKLSEQDTPLFGNVHMMFYQVMGAGGIWGGGHEKNVALKGGKGGKKT